MRWKKLGKIFDPSDYKLPNGRDAFARSPQAIVFEDFVRIYFCTAKLDENKKYISHVAFADFNKDFNKILGISGKTVLENGALGCFDEHGIFPINVIKEKDRILAYITGWSRRISVSVETSVGLAISTDNGITFKKSGNGPVLTASLNEPFLVCDSFVKKLNGIYHMWYIFGRKWINTGKRNESERIYKIAHATSTDGVQWKRDGKSIIPDKLNSNECQALPSVIKYKNQYHMYFCYREATEFRNNRERTYKIGYAFSDDLISWTRNDEDAGIELSENGWDSQMQCYPHIFQCDNRIYLLYNGNDFGRYGFGIAVLEEN